MRRGHADLRAVARGWSRRRLGVFDTRLWDGVAGASARPFASTLQGVPPRIGPARKQPTSATSAQMALVMPAPALDLGEPRTGAAAGRTLSRRRASSGRLHDATAGNK